MRRVDSLEKTDAGRDWGQEEKGMTEDEMAGWHHWLDGRESEWTPGVGDGQGGLVCCNSWGRKESDMTEQLKWTEHFNYCTVNKANYTPWCGLAPASYQVKVLREKSLRSPKEMRICLHPSFRDNSFPLCLFPSDQLCRFHTCKPHGFVSQFLKINLSLPKILIFC